MFAKEMTPLIPRPDVPGQFHFALEDLTPQPGEAWVHTQSGKVLRVGAVNEAVAKIFLYPTSRRGPRVPLIWPVAEFLAQFVRAPI